MTAPVLPIAPDADLLDAWHHFHDPAALRALCERHCGLVESACRRAGSPDVAEAAQAVFLILSRRAGAVSGPRLGAWLAATATRVVANQHRAAARRRRHERAAAVEQARIRGADGEDDTPWDEARPHLDAALASLSPGRREAILRFYLAGRPQADIAAELGCSVAAVKMRVHEGLDSLRHFFKRKGIAIGAGVIAAGLTADASAATDAAPLIDLCVRAVEDPAAAAPGAAGIAHAVTNGMILTSAAIAAAICAGVGSCLAAVILLSAQSAAPPPPADDAPHARATLATAHDPGPVAAAAHAATSAAIAGAGHAPPPAARRDAILDPEHARLYVVATAPSLPHLTAALKQLPEFRLIPAAALPALDPLFGLRDVDIVMDPLAQLPHATSVGVWRFLLTGDGTDNPDPGKPVAADIPLGAFHAAADFLPGDAGAAAHAWFTAALPGLGIPGARITDRADGLEFALGDPRDLDAAAVLAPFNTLSATAPADVRVACVVDPGIPGKPMVPLLDLALATDAGGAHVTVDLRNLAGVAPKTYASADPASLDRIPAGALAGAVLHVTPDSLFAGLLATLSAAPTATGAAPAAPAPPATGADAAIAAHAAPDGADNPASGAATAAAAATSTGTLSVSYLAQGLTLNLSETDADRRARLRTILGALDRIDGDALFWFQPGTPMPAFCCTIPMPQAAAAQLAAAVNGDLAAGVTIPVNDQIALHAGWRDGRLIATTDPAGIAAIGAGGGFAQNPEVRRILPDLPTGGSPLLMIMRPAACLDQVEPLLDLILPADQMTGIQAYHAALREQNGCGWLAGIHPNGDAERVEAGGVLALAAFVAVMQAAQHPVQLLKIAN